MKRILSLVALVVFAGPILADDKARIKDLEDRLTKVEATISWKTTESTPCGLPKEYTFNGIPHTFINGSYHPYGKVSTAPPLTSSPVLPMSSGLRVVQSGTGYPAQIMPQYHGGMVHFTTGCANGRCGR